MQDLSLSNRYVTLSQLWADYRRCRNLKPNTVAVYDRCINRCIPDWLTLPVNQITKAMIEERHTQLSQTKAMANLIMRILRALFTFASYRYEDTTPLINPVRRLSELRKWNKVPRRKGTIKPHQMKEWFDHTLSLPNKIAADYLIFLLLTGLRRAEAATLEFSNVDFDEKTFTVKDTKNHEDHTLPMSDYVFDLLRRRRKTVKGNYVFPGRFPGSHISLWSQTHKEITQATGITFMVHDLRRTFITVADGLDFPDRTIKHLANHKTNDITERYIIRNIERLRAPMQAITDEILKQAELLTDPGPSCDKGD